MLVISGAFGLFRKSSVISVGGYRTDTVGEDMELVVRLHRMHRKQRIPYRIVFVPNPVCWTEVPDSLRVLKNQRMRWQRGLSESLSMNMGLFLSPHGGWVGWLAFPFTLIFEWFGPVIEVLGYIFMIVGFSLGVVSLPAFLAFTLLAIVLGILQSVSALMLEEMSFHLYPRPVNLHSVFYVCAGKFWLSSNNPDLAPQRPAALAVWRQGKMGCHAAFRQLAPTQGMTSSSQSVHHAKIQTL